MTLRRNVPKVKLPRCGAPLTVPVLRFLVFPSVTDSPVSAALIPELFIVGIVWVAIYLVMGRTIRVT